MARTRVRAFLGITVVAGLLLASTVVSTVPAQAGKRTVVIMNPTTKNCLVANQGDFPHQGSCNALEAKWEFESKDDNKTGTLRNTYFNMCLDNNNDRVYLSRAINEPTASRCNTSDSGQVWSQITLDPPTTHPWLYLQSRLSAGKHPTVITFWSSGSINMVPARGTAPGGPGQKQWIELR